MNTKESLKMILNTIIRKQKIAMLHSGRCGSTVLGSMLNQHPSFHWSGEPFEKLKREGRSLSREKVKYVIQQREQDTVSKIYSFATKYSYGMHLSENCINMNIPDFVSLLLNLGYKKYIIITRKNHLKHVVSIINGRVSGDWHTQKVTGNPNPVHVTIDDFEVGINMRMPLTEYFKQMDKETELLIDSIGGKPLLILEYETDIEDDPMKAYRKVCEFVGITVLKPEIKLKRTNPFPLNKLIINYIEVKKRLQDTPYVWMVYE